MDSGALAALVEFGAREDMDSLVVARHGRIVAEAYYAPFRATMKHRINSATKSVVGMLAGIAVSRGVLPPADTPVLPLLAPTDVKLDTRKSSITLQHLLDMTSGLEWTEPLIDGAPRSLIDMQRSGDWLRFILERPAVRPPGQTFNYSSGNSHLVSTLIARRAGMSTQDFARRHLFDPLGIGAVTWRADPQGVAIGGWGLYMTTRDMARLGQLYLQRGEWEGRQVVPRDWAQKVFRPTVVMQPQATRLYADSWWVIPELGAYMMVGFQRQMVVVLPAEGIVAAVTGRSAYPHEALVRHLLRAVKAPEAIAPDAAALAELRRRVELASSDRADALPAPGPLATQVSGRTYRIAPNARSPLDLQELVLHLEGEGRYELTVRGRDGTARKVARTLGLQGWVEAPDGSGELSYSRAAWVRPDALLLVARWPEEARAASYLLTFEGRRVDIAYTPPFGPEVRFSGESD